MLPDWSFSQLDFPHLPTSLDTTVNNVGQKTATTTPQSIVSANITTPSGLRRSSAILYPRLHLLGLPNEIRLAIWKAIYNDVMLGVKGEWFDKPATAWDGLTLTCRQTLEEVSNFWPRGLVPLAKVDNFLSQPYSAELSENFRHLTLELPFNLLATSNVALASALVGLASSLEDLRLFFVGKDRSGEDVNFNACGSREASMGTISENLQPMGQYHHERQSIFTALFFMQNLRSLVLKNINYPLFQSMILKHKPQPEYLHISTDSRTNLHKDHELEGQQALIMPPKEDFPPVKVLHISTNSALTAVQTVSKLTATLEELNWSVADSSRQWFNWHWLEETAIMLERLRRHAVNLRVLRICIETKLYEGHAEYGTLIGAFKQHLPQLDALEVLELHIHSKSPWFGQEIIEALPKSLKRLYISDKLISTKVLESFVSKRYLEGIAEDLLWDEDDVAFYDLSQRPFKGHNQKPAKKGKRVKKGKSHGVQNHTTKTPASLIGLNDLPFEDMKALQDKGSGMDGQVGEPDIGRRDYIPMRKGRLGFVTMEYEQWKWTNTVWSGDGKTYEDDDDATKLAMVRLNGKLLDRERNSHLAFYDGGCLIPSKTHDSFKNMTTSGKEWYNAEEEWQKWNDEEVGQATKGLKLGYDKAGYFGEEDGAQGVFEEEIAMKIENLPRLKWPEEVHVLEKEHWMSQS